MVSDILGLSTRPVGDDTKRVKALIRKLWCAPEDVVIMVSELRCYKDGCPDVETVVAIMEGNSEPTKVKIDKPIAELDAGILALHQPF